ncbi:MAG: LysE family transporter [Alphaproteobacteria bacterium]|nr:LysE family transporter [Alphaproteobacteria bacterium]
MTQLLILLLKGLGIGLLIAAPVGPVNLICIRRTLAFGQVNGFLTGTGAALGDGLFALLVAFGLTAASTFVLGYADIVAFLGGGILIGMGLRTYFAPPPRIALHDPAIPPRRRRRLERLQEREGWRTLLGAIWSTFLLTVTNPFTLVGFFALFAGLSGTLAEEGSYLTAALLVGSVVAGSALWWFALSKLIAAFRNRVSRRALQWINRVSGFLLGCFGLVLLVRLLFGPIV